jgi:predicted dehydrogenase
MTLRIAVIGTGKIANSVTPHIQAAEGCSVVGAASRSADRAMAFAKGLSIEHAWTEDQLMSGALDAFDAAYITTPNHNHPAWCQRLLAAGKHVLCEKPLCWTREQAQALFTLAENNKRVLVEAFTFEHAPLTHQLIDLVRAGDASPIGRTTEIQAEFHVPIAVTPNSNVRCSRQLCGGATMDLGCYPLGWARLLTGEEPAEMEVTGELKHLSESDDPSDTIDAWARARGVFPSGIAFDLRWAMDRPGHADGLIIGQRGAVRVPDHLRPSNATILAGPDTTTLEAVGGKESYRFQAESFARACAGQGPAMPSPAWSIGQAGVIERVLRSLELKF